MNTKNSNAIVAWIALWIGIPMFVFPLLLIFADDSPAESFAEGLGMWFSCVLFGTLACGFFGQLFGVGQSR